MDIDTIKERLQAFAEARDWDKFHNPKNLVMALSVEASELVEEFQWLTDTQATQLKEDAAKLAKVSDEVADVAIYLIRLVDKLGIDLEQSIYAKIKKNESKYPAEKVRGSAKKYDEYD